MLKRITRTAVLFVSALLSGGAVVGRRGPCQ